MNNKTIIAQRTSHKCRIGVARYRLIRPAGAFLLLACLFLPGQARASATLPTVAPAHVGQNDKVTVGYLTVFSSTQETEWGEGSYYYAHTGYRIYDSRGKEVKWVENHNTSIDEDPEKVELSPGTYTIWAQSDRDGYVKMPVVIKLARITAVHLET